MIPPDVDINKGVELLLKGESKPKPPPKNLFIIDCNLLITSSIFGGVGPFLNPPFPLPPPPGGVPHGL